MIEVGIAAVPNQTFSVQIDDRTYAISLREANGVMCASITRDGVAVVTNMRLTAGTPVLPYRYQEEGNFVMLTENESLPYYDQFGVTQFLVYLSASELTTLRG